jgi:hypothetical protein
MHIKTKHAYIICKQQAFLVTYILMLDGYFVQVKRPHSFQNDIIFTNFIFRILGFEEIGSLNSALSIQVLVHDQ